MDKITVLLLFVLLLVAGCEKNDDSPSVGWSSDNNQSQGSVNGLAENNLSDTGIVIAVPERNPQEYLDLVAPVREPKIIDIYSRLNASIPVIDGIEESETWSHIEAVETLDYSSQRPITIKSCHDSKQIFFLVSFPDPDMNAEHKSWVWLARENVYIEGLDREDALVLKWRTTGGNMSFLPALIEPHTADIWFWKASRTNPSGYFDDKSQIVRQEDTGGGLQVPSEKYDRLFLYRNSDTGKGAYEEKIFFKYQGPALKRFYPVEPKGSRADVVGKGIWSDGKWTVEFARDFQTHDQQDIAFSSGNNYEFGISLYEMACTGIEPQWYKPLYRTGNVFDTLNLIIE